MKFVVLFTNNEGGEAVLCDSLEAAKQKAREWVDEGEPGLNAEEREHFESDLAAVNGEYPQPVRGSEAWKETIYIAPITEQADT